MCQANELFWCVDNTVRTITSLAANACALGGGSTSSGTDALLAGCINRVLTTVQLVLKIVDDTMVIACGSTDTGVCLANTPSRINLQITETCGVLPGIAYSDGANRCVDKLLDIVNGLLAAARTQMEQACGSSDPLICAVEVLTDVLVQVETIHDAVANICKGNTSTSSTTDSAATNCASKVLDTAELTRQLVIQSADGAMITACQSTAAEACLANLLTKINMEVTGICTSVPGTSYSDGANGCIDKVLQIVNALIEFARQQMAQACGSRDPLSCVSTVIADLLVQVEAIHDNVANICNDQIATTSTSESATTNCATKVLETLDAAREVADDTIRDSTVLICGSDAGLTCAAKIPNDAAQILENTCDPAGTGQTCDAYLTRLCQTRTALPDCAREILSLINLGYDSGLETVFSTTVAPVDATFCTDRTICDAVIGAVAQMLAQDLRAGCSDDDLACLGMYSADLTRINAGLSLLLCSSDGCAAYVSDMIVTGLVRNLQISGTLVTELLEGLPSDPRQLEVAVARDAELPDPIIDSLVDLVFGGPGSASTDEDPGTSDGPGGAQAITGNGDGKRRCTFRGTSYNKNSMDIEGAENPDDPNTTGSGGFSYTDDYLGAHADNMSYVHSPPQHRSARVPLRLADRGSKVQVRKGEVPK